MYNLSVGSPETSNKSGSDLMKSTNSPINLDSGIVLDESKPKPKKSKKIPWVFIASGLGVILIIILLFIKPENSRYIESPPPAEQAERDSIFAAAGEIAQYLEDFDSLPAPADISLPSNLIYEKEDDVSWAIETETGLYYTSDMNIESFGLGEI